MAQLKDLIVNGASRFVGPISADTATLNTVTANEYTITKISALTASATTATTYGNGSNGQVLKSNGTNVYWASDANSNTVPSAYCTTSATVTAKVASCTSYALLANSYIPVIIGYTNTVSNTAITLNINSRGAKPIYLNGSITSSTNYDLKAGSYIAYYDGTGYHFRTDGKITGNITGTAANVTGTVAVENGGTGKTTAKAAANGFINALDTGTAGKVPEDDDYFISQYIGGNNATTTSSNKINYYRRPMSTLWEYTKEKMTNDSDVNISGTSANVTGTVAIAHGGTGATTAAAARTNLGAAPAYVYSTTDLTAGTSTLTTGVLYFVYE